MEDFGAMSYPDQSKLGPQEGRGFWSLLALAQRIISPLLPSHERSKYSVLNSFCLVSFLSSTHTIYSTCGPLCHCRPRSATDPQLFPQTSLACLEAFLVSAWQGSNPVGPKVLPFISLRNHLSRATQLPGVPGQESW